MIEVFEKNSVTSDDILIAQTQSGNNQAFEILIEKNTEVLRAYLRGMNACKETIEDILQETFTTAYLYFMNGKYTHNGKLLRWLKRMVHNKYIDTKRREKNIPSANALPVNHTDAYIDEEWKLTSIIDPEKEYISIEVPVLIDEMIHMLPEEQKEVFILRQYCDLSFKEIAGLTKVGINTVLGRYRYARIGLMKMLQDEETIVA